MEVLLFTDVARGYCCNNQASRERKKERPPEPAKTLFVLHPLSGRRECVRGEVWVGWERVVCVHGSDAIPPQRVQHSAPGDTGGAQGSWVL